MSKLSAGREASSGVGASRYERHRPERTLLYQLIQAYYPALQAQLAVQGTELLAYVQREFEAYLECGRLERGFLRVRCESCHGEHLLAFSCKRRGFRTSCGARCMTESTALLVDEVFTRASRIRCVFCSRADPRSWALSWAGFIRSMTALSMNRPIGEA